MSTNFFVYPGKEYVPSFKQLLDLGNQNIAKHLALSGELKAIRLNVELHSIREHSKIEFCTEDKAIWDEDCYAWFFINDIPGGTDAYFYKTTDLDREIWEDECETREASKRLKQTIDRSLQLGYFWSFRRSAGQPAIINLTYGLLAAAMAKLTDGFIYSDDGAWDYNCLPAIADDFLKWYFRPELAASKDKEWFERCIRSITNELSK